MLKPFAAQGTDELPGLIPLAVSTVLKLGTGTSCSVEISYYEVYMRRCYDLLEPKDKEIMALDDQDGNLQLKGLAWVILLAVTMSLLNVFAGMCLPWAICLLLSFHGLRSLCVPWRNFTKSTRKVRSGGKTPTQT
jgi:hypothetical protein